MNSRDRAEYKEAFALFDKKGTGAIPRDVLGDLLRALGQNPTQAEVADIVSKAPRDGKIPPCFEVNPPRDPLTVCGACSGLSELSGDFEPVRWVQTCRYPGCVKSVPNSTTERGVVDHSWVIEEFIRGFQVFDKEGNGYIGAGELRYVLTQLGEKMSDEEVDELLKGVQIGAYVFHIPHLIDCNLTRRHFHQ